MRKFVVSKNNFFTQSLEKINAISWDYNKLSMDRNLPLNFIQKHKNNLSFHELSKNKNITTEFILENFTENWDWEYIDKFHYDFIFENRTNLIRIFNKKIKFEDIILALQKNPKLDFCWSDISARDFLVSWETVAKNQRVMLNDVSFKIPWDYDALLENDNITYEIITKNFYYHPTGVWNMRRFSGNKNNSMKIVLSYKRPGQPWDWENWNWNQLSGNLSITLADITSNPSLPWDWEEISKRPDASVDFVNKHRN